MAATGGAAATGGTESTGGSMATGGSAPTGGTSGKALPCDGICPNPTAFSLTASAFTSPQLGTAASCWQTFDTVHAVTLNYFDSRTMQVNSTAVDSSSALPVAHAGGWCFVVSTGAVAYATFTVRQ